MFLPLKTKLKQFFVFAFVFVLFFVVLCFVLFCFFSAFYLEKVAVITKTIIFIVFFVFCRLFVNFFPHSESIFVTRPSKGSLLFAPQVLTINLGQNACFSAVIDLVTSFTACTAVSGFRFFFSKWSVSCADLTRKSLSNYSRLWSYQGRYSVAFVVSTIP